ncbi:MAG: ATPase [Paracoccaceae bacterium]
MIYASADAWRAAPEKRAMLFGMSGLGKTRVASILRAEGSWFHYSVDYRIGTRWMGEHIADNAKREAMRVPFLRDLLLSDSISIRSNITFDNLTPLSAYLGKPGDPARGGLPFDDYEARQARHRAAEVAALRETGHFIDRARDLYGYPNFVCDAGGSICEVVDAADPADPVMTHLAARLLPVWIEGTPAHTEALKARFDRAPKPMCYAPATLAALWRDWLAQGHDPATTDPDAFVRFAYATAIDARQPLYAAMARWGVTVAAADVERVTSAADFTDLIADALDAHQAA